MANKNKTARPAARKQSHTKTKKTVATRSATAATKREPITQVVERAQPRLVVEPPKMKGELPVPTATFYF
ncbi:MAG TPA: hypothetical protein VL463_35605 [Kofleriaceae bacterium]|jgi:hypothetical protein|nr:hypothetical protein [Kofleriaceae bacterium]